MLDYQTKGYTKYGADMGRRSTLAKDTSAPLTVRHVPIDAGGYDPGGAYWGSPDNLYLVSDDEGGTFYHRAGSSEEVRALFPRATWLDNSAEASEEDLADMFLGYTEGALGSSTTEDGEPLDENHTEADLSEECRAEMRKDCEAFAKENATALRHVLGTTGPYGRREVDWSLIGYHFFMTRSGSGVGFTDGDYLEPEAEGLQKAARTYGEVNLYAADDGKIYNM